MGLNPSTSLFLSFLDNYLHALSREKADFEFIWQVTNSHENEDR